MIDVANKYVVYYFNRLRDGHEEVAQVVTGIEAAVKLANEWRPDINRHNCDILVFKLGEHVPLVEEVTEIPQPSKTATVFKLPANGGTTTHSCDLLVVGDDPTKWPDAKQGGTS